MFKRANKITALLVAAAAVVSLVPATGASAAEAKRLANKEGTVKQGVAYDGGAYDYYGYRTDKDLTGIYFNKGGEATDKANSDLEDYRFDTLSKYGTQYAYAHEQSNKDEYLVDLKSGEIVSDETKEEKTSHDKTDLVSKLKKADRYNGTADLTDNNLASFEQVLQGQFGEVWYKYAAYGDKVVSVSNGSSATISVPVLTKAEFTAKANAAVVGVGFPGTVAGKSFTYLPAGSSAIGTRQNTDALALAYYVDATGAKKAFNVATVAPQPVTTGAGATASTITYNSTDVDANGNTVTLAGGTYKTALDSLISDYSAYVRNNLVRTPLLNSGTPVAIIDGFDYYLKDKTNPVAVAAFDSKVAALNAKLTQVETDATTAVIGGTIITNYADYQGLIANTINDKLDAVDTNAAVPLFPRVGTLDTDGVTVDAIDIHGAQGAPITHGVAIDPTKSTVDVTAYDLSALDSISTRQALETKFGSAFVNGSGAGAITNNKFYGFTAEAGKYVDASYTADMKVYSSTKGRAVKIERYDEENKDAQLTVHLDSIDAIAQDKDFIYTLTKVTVTGAGSVQQNQVFVQKISKAQGDKETGAYTPKSVESFQVNTGIYDYDDATDARKILLNEDNDSHQYLLGMSVKDGKSLFITRAKNDNVKVWKLDLNTTVKKDVIIAGTTLHTDVDTEMLVQDDTSDTDVFDMSLSTAVEDEGLQGITRVKAVNDEEEIKLAGETLYKHPSVSIDVNGNTWAVKKTKITKFDGLDKKEDIYTIDGAMDAIDVYDDNSLIAWDTDGDRYTNIKEGIARTEDEGINVNPDLNKDKFKNGYDATDKKFYKDGAVVTNAWASDAGKWYLLDATGVAKTGWSQNASGVWYLLGTDGAMLTGWQQDAGNWYYLNPVNTSGAMVTGWFQDTTGTWYYTDASGKMLSNTTVGGYTLGASGAWVK